MDAVRSLVVDAAEVERAERIVRRPDHEQPGETAGELLDASRRAAVSNAASCSPARPRRSPRPALSSCGRPGGGEAATRIDLLGAGRGDLFEQPLQRAGPIAQPVRFAAPRSFGRERA